MTSRYDPSMRENYNASQNTPTHLRVSTNSRYDVYVAYCERLHITPMTETQWNLSQ
jgi:hypothetical protein